MNYIESHSVNEHIKIPYVKQTSSIRGTGKFHTWNTRIPYVGFLRTLLLLLTLFAGPDAWAQTDYSGYYYISGNNQGADSYVANDRVNNYYLCPTVNWIYYDAAAANKFTNVDNGQPFLTTYHYRNSEYYNKNGATDSTEAVWHIVKHTSLNYYYIIHEKTGKYLASNAGLGANSNANRLRVHLETVATPPPTDDRFLFAITKPSYYNISPKGNSGWYLNITEGNLNSLQGATSAKQDGPDGYKSVGGTLGLWSSASDKTSKWYFEEAFLEFPTITINAAGNVEISTHEADATIYYTTDGSDPQTSGTKQVYSGAITPTTSMTAIKARVIHNSNGRRSEIATQPLYTYHIVNLDKEIAIKYKVAQYADVTLSGYLNIPAAIRSPYLEEETLTFYSFSQPYSESKLIAGNVITKTPTSSADIYVTYTNTHLMSKFLHLRASRTLNLTINGDYIYDSGGGTLAHNASATDADKETNAYLWYMGRSGHEDPYAVQIKNKDSNKFLNFTTPSTLALADDASNFILMSGSAAGDDINYEQMELMAATGDDNYYRVGRTGDDFSISTTASGDASLQVRAYPSGKGLTYHLIDKAGKLITTIPTKSTALTLPDAWQSPLVETYHFWSEPNKVEDTYTPTGAIGDLEVDPDIIPDIYVTYDVNHDVAFHDPAGDVASTTYMLKFYGGESFRQENGKDALMPSTQKAVYPYSNGDAMLYVYGQEQWDAQLASGASTRSRWLWYVVSPNNDPYRVRIMSVSNQVGSKNFFRTYAVDYGGSTHIVTNLTTENEAVDADHANQLPTEYMILKAPNDHYKLVTTSPITDGTTTEHRTVTSFEQYWKNNPTVQRALGGAAVTESETFDDNIELTSVQRNQLPNYWHTYKAFANAAPWVEWKTDATGSGKQYLNKNHWFQTVDMGSTGEFTFEATTLEPQVILLDQHGWEVMRAPLSNTAKLRQFDSPMVETYHWYPTATKVNGYHKYTVGSANIVVYSSYVDGDKTKWRDSGERTTHTSTSLADIPYDHFTEKGFEAQDASVKTDFYVTYDVKSGYSRLYTGAATEGATSASAVMLQQGDKYAKIKSDYSLDTAESISLNQENTDEEWYLKPNFNIDAEMGYKYRGEPGAYDEALSKLETETAYYTAGKNGFDPYNVQIQSVAYDSYYFTANTTGSELSAGMWTGESSAITLETLRTDHQTPEGYDQSTLQITNATFMVVNDGSEHMLLMPRFDHTKVVNALTGTQMTSPGEATNYLSLTISPTVVHSSDEIVFMTGNYILADDFTLTSSIGTSTNPFKGSIDGNYRTLSGFSVPLVRYAEDAVIKNVILNDVSISTDDNVGAIAANATGDTRIYNCGILASGSTRDENGIVTSCSSTVSGTDCVGGIVGFLDGNARVINCFSYANITGGTDVGGIVGYNNVSTTAAMMGAGNGTMVMNCMFYGDITGGTTVSPVYGGKNINNLHGGLNNYNYYAFDELKTTAITDGKYNCALAVEQKNLIRFEFYRQLLNSNRRLAAYYASSPNYATVYVEDMMKWVLETADRSITSREPYPYPILKVQDKYPSIINFDVENAPNSTSVGRNKGGKLGKTLSVTIRNSTSGGQTAPAGANISTTITLQRTDKDFDRYNFNYDKVQLPYYNDYGTKNYTDNKVVTGWKIVDITAVAGDPYTSSNYPTSGVKDFPDHNYADRKSSNKDLYSVSRRVFSQGAYFDVPYGVTSITIEPYWGNAAYVADEYMDVVYNTSYEAPKTGSVLTPGVTQLGKQFPTGKITINDSEQTVHTSISSALGALSGTSVYDDAVVLVGNLHQNGVPSNGTAPFTIMSADLDHDNEPDYSMIYHHNNRKRVSPIRFDFINIPGTAQAQKPNGASTVQNFTIFTMNGWFETTNTCIVYSNQVEYENNQDNAKKVDSPLILLGGDFEQFVSTRASSVSGKTIYIHVGSNVCIKNFGVGTHSDGNKGTPHIPVSVTGGEFEGFYLTGTYNPNAAEMSDNAECYISGGHFVEAAGACQEPLGGNVHWQIYDADIDAFYGGGINDARPIKGTITTDIYNSHVTLFCGGPKFGNMTTGKAVTTNATGCVFDQYFGAGYGGLSYSRQKYYDESGYDFDTHSFPYTSERGKYYDGTSTNANNSHTDYGKKGPGVAIDFDYEFFVWSTGVTGARMYVKFASFSLAQCDNVFSTLKGCTVNKNFYGGGSLGKVTGTATSVLEDCTVNGNVFGGGYSGTLPTLEVRNAGFTQNPKFNSASGMFEPGVFSGTTTYTWKNAAEAGVTLTNGQSGSDETNHYIYTNQDLTTLGQVGHTVLTIKGTTKVSGIVEGETLGGVFGGGDMSAVNGTTQVNIQATDATDGVVNVFGGGNTANVIGTATVSMTGGTVKDDVYGGGKGQTTQVTGNVTVGISAGTVSRNVYGGSAYGTVNTTAVTLSGGTVSGSVFGGGLGQTSPSNIAAQNLGNATVSVTGGTVGTAVYGGSNANGVLKGDATVTITGGTIGTAPEVVGDPIADVVFGGGYGEPTLVEGNVLVNIGTSGAASGPVINGHVYGGGALGSVNTSKPESALVFDATKKVDVNLYKGTIHGNVYGGGLGRQAVTGPPAVAAVESFVGGDVTVKLDGAAFHLATTTLKDDADKDVTAYTSGQIFGGNNLNGTPKGHVLVHVKRTVPETEHEGDAYYLGAVYGGGNEANYVPTDTKQSAEVVIEGCDVTRIKDVYGGGNAAAAPATEVWILACKQIENVFGGGNGELGSSRAAHVGFYREADLSKTNYAGGTGKTFVNLVGGTITNVFGGSNSNGDIRSGSNIKMPQQSEYTGAAVLNSPAENCTLHTTNIYGGGKNADMSGGTSIVLGCMPDEWVGEIYAGAQNADVAGDVNLTITSGKFYRVFGGNKDGGRLKGSITVNIEETGDCDVPIVIGELYGGGNLAGYSIYGYTDAGEPRTKAQYDAWFAGLSADDKLKPENQKYDNPKVNVRSFTSIGKIFGGGYQALMIADPHVDINVVEGSKAATARAEETIEHIAIKKKNESTGEIESAEITLHLPAHEADKIGAIDDVFGGGNLATVDGSTEVNIGTETTVDFITEPSHLGTKGTDYTYDEVAGLYGATVKGAIIKGSVYGGGNQADVTGSTQVNICAKYDELASAYQRVAQGSAHVTIDKDVFGAGKGEPSDATSALVSGNTTIVMMDGYVMQSVYGGGELSQVAGNTYITVSGGTIGTPKDGDTRYGGEIYGNIYGGGKGNTTNVLAGRIQGNTNITVENVYADAAYAAAHSVAEGSLVSSPTILHNIYGGGAHGSVGTFTYDASDVITGYSSGGIAAINITGGTIGYDGHNNGMVFGSSRGEVGAPDAICDKLAWVYRTNVTIGTTVQDTNTTNPSIKGSVYGSGENGHTYENASVTIHSGMVGITDTSIDGGAAYLYRGNVYGGGCGTDKYWVDANNNEIKEPEEEHYNPKGGLVKGTATVQIDGGHVVRDVYGAGSMGSVDVSSSVTVAGNAIIGAEGSGGGYVFAAARGDNTLDDAHQTYVGASELHINGGTIWVDAYGGGQNGIVKGAVAVSMTDGTVMRDVYGGGALAKTNTEYDGSNETYRTYVTSVTMSGGTITGNLYGGGLGEYSDDSDDTNDIPADVNGPLTVAVTGGSVTNVFGCNNVHGMPKSTVAVEIGSKSGASAPYTYSGTGVISGSVYGGGKDAAYNGTPAVKIYKGTMTNVYGGGLGSTAITGGSSVTMEGGTVNNDVFGGGSEADVTGDVNVVVSGGSVYNDVYGGGALANTNTGNWSPGTNTEYIRVDALTAMSFTAIDDPVLESGESVYGYYTKDVLSEPYTYTEITDKAATADGTSVYYKRNPGSSVYGLYLRSGVSEPYTYTEITDEYAQALSGTDYYERRELPGTWADGKNDPSTGTTYKTTVTLTGGEIGNVYGGGLGSLGASPTKAYVFGDVSVYVNRPADITTTQSGSFAVFTNRTENATVGGTSYTSIPLTGRVFGCNNLNGSPMGNVLVEVWATRHLESDGTISTIHKNYEIQHVYGGGNQAAYLPARDKRTSVNIYGCDETSISRVYGGGNSASVPSTNVTIWGTYDIEYAFGGGNGGQPVKENGTGTWIANSGANVNGAAHITLHGGKVGQVFGGSDYKGDCRSANNTISQEGTCPLVITKFYGAGSEANVDGDVNTIVAACTGENSQIEYVCGGSYKAYINGNVNLTITAGYFQNVYGGNDQRGGIEGNITVNVEETDPCNKPIIIGNLVGGGNQAPFPGKDGAGNDLVTTKSRTITVNVKSATYIGNVYGGSYMAETKADTKVNINMIEGEQAGSTNVLLPADFGIVGAEIPKNIKSVTSSYEPVSVSAGEKVVGYYTKDGSGNYIAASGTAVGGTTYYQKQVKGNIDNAIGTIGNVYGGGKQGSVDGNTEVNIGTETSVGIIKRDGTSHHIVDKDGNDIFDADGNLLAGKKYGDIVLVSQTVRGAHITGDVFGGGESAVVTGNAIVNICAKDNGEGYESVDEGAEKVTIGGSVYGGGREADIEKNTQVTMSGGYVFNGVFGGGLSGSVGTYTSRDYSSTVYGHTAHAGCIGKPTVCQTGTGKCTVVVNGGQIGPVEVATQGMRRALANGGPVTQGWVWGGGFGLIEDPKDHPDTHFMTYVNETDVTIGGTAFIMEGVIGGGEFGRVLGNTKVTIRDNCQIGVGENKAADGKPVRYGEALWAEAAAAIASGSANDIATIAAKMPECSYFEYGHDWDDDGKLDYLPYDPYYDEFNSPAEFSPASTAHPSDGKTWIGVVFGGGSGYMPYKKANGSGYDWLRSAGWVEGNTTVEIKGGHVLTNVYGANEYTDVGGKATVKMTGGTIGVPRTLAQIAAHPVSCYLFGGGRGDERTHFNQITNVGSVEVEVSGGIIYGSVFGGGEDGHVLGDTKVTIKPGAMIGTWGTSYVDGNVFGGGRGFSGESLTAGLICGNTEVNIEGGTILGSIYGGGRLASVGTYMVAKDNPNYGKMIPDGQDPYETGSTSHGHVTVNISGGTIGNSREFIIPSTADNTAAEISESDIDKWEASDWNKWKTYKNVPKTEYGTFSVDRLRLMHTIGGNVFAGGMGRKTHLNGTAFEQAHWTKLGEVKSTKLNISEKEASVPTLIRSNVYGGGEFGSVTESHTTDDKKWATEISITGGTIGTEVLGDATKYTFGSVYGGGMGAAVKDATSTAVLGGLIENGNTKVTMSAGTVKASVYGGGEIAAVSGTANEETKTLDGGNTDVTITGGTIGKMKLDPASGAQFGGYRMGNVYGGGKGDNSSPLAGLVKGNATVTIGTDDGGPTIYHNIYGGGSYGTVGTYNFDSEKFEITSLEYVNTGRTQVLIKGGTIGIDGRDNGMVNGGGRGNIDAPQSKMPAGKYSFDHVAWVYDSEVVIGAAASTGPIIKGSVYGGGENGHNMRNASVTVKSGTIGIHEGNDYDKNRGNVYGAGCGTDKYYSSPSGAADPYDGGGDKYNPLGGIIKGNTTVSIEGGTLFRNVYGGGSMGSVDGKATVTVSGGSVSGNVFGAPKGNSSYTEYIAYTGSSEVNIQSGASVTGSVYGGGEAGRVKGDVVVDMTGGTVSQNVYGGGALADSNTDNWDATLNSNAGGWTNTTKKSALYTTQVSLTGGTVGHDVYGGALGRVYKAAQDAQAAVYYTQTECDEYNTANNLELGMEGFRTTADIKTPAVEAQAEETAISPKVYGDILVELNGKTTFAGETPTVTPVAESAKGCIVEKVFGCNDLMGTPKGHVKVHVFATQNSKTGNIKAKVAPPTYSPKRNVNDSEGYKAWLARLIAVAKPGGTLLDGLDETVISAAQKVLDGITKDEEDLDDNDRETLNGEAKKVIKEIESLHDYDVKAVYGGGDLAAYEPFGPNATTSAEDHKNTTETTEVVIEGCDVTSIQQVYGGGNAASVSGTNVIVSSVFVIDELFGGGNGMDNYVVNGKWYQNPGANVGYYPLEEHVTDGSKGNGETEGTRYQTVSKANTGTKEQRIANYSYGTGYATTSVTGGHIHTVYGGSNEKGNVRTVALSQYQKAGSCPLVTDETYGGSKTAMMDGEIQVVLDCVEDGGTYYGGSQNADINNNVTINITNGSYDKIYGGNNKAGTINGVITINIEEKGCTPIIIGELYGCGYYAPYSVYGYKKKADGTYETIEEEDPTDPTKKINSRIPLKKGDTGALAMPHRDPYVNIISATWIGSIYGGGDRALVVGNPHVNVNMQKGKVTAEYAGNAAFNPGVHGSGTAQYTVEKIEANGDATLSVGKIGNIFGGGNQANVIGNTYVDVGTGKWNNVNGVEETIAPARNAATITGNIYGGGKMGHVGDFTLDGTDKPVSCADGTGIARVTVSNGSIGPDNMAMFHLNASGNIPTDDAPDNAGHVFGGGQGTNLPADVNVAYVDSAEVIINGTAFVKGSVFGGGENGHVLHNVGVKISGDCQIGNGHVILTDSEGNIQKDESGEYILRGLNRPYTDDEWANGRLTEQTGDFPGLSAAQKTAIYSKYNASLPECDSWLYGATVAAGKVVTNSHHVPYDCLANATGELFEYPTVPDITGVTTKSTHGGCRVATNGSAFNGSVYGGGSGYFPYAPGQWLESAGKVEGNTWVLVSGGHILTSLYGGTEMTSVDGDTHVIMTGGTVGVPRTLSEITAHPVTCYVFGGGKGEGRAFLNGVTTVGGNAYVTVSDDARIYGSVFGGAEDGWVEGNVYLKVKDGKAKTVKVNGVAGVETKEVRFPLIGTWGTSYVDGNIFGGGRGFDGINTLAGRIGGNVNVDISDGTMLGSVYGGGRLGSVGIGKIVDDEDKAELRSGESYGVITVNISGGTIGNDLEYQYVDADNYATLTNSTSGDLRLTEFNDAASFKNKIKDEGGLITEAGSATTIRRLLHTKGGNVVAGCMGRLTKIDGTTMNTNWDHLALAKKTVLTISQADANVPTIIKSNVYGGGEFGAVMDFEAVDADATTINITGGIIGTAITKTFEEKVDAETTITHSNVPQYYFGSVFGGGYGSSRELTKSEEDAGIKDPRERAGLIRGNTVITMSGGTVLGSIYGGGEVAQTEGSSDITISGGEVGVNKVRKSDGYVMYGSSLMGNVYGAGKGTRDYTKAGVVKGNTEVTVSGGNVYHNVYGGGALASVGDFKISDGEGTPAYIPLAGVPYDWTEDTGLATINITGGTIGISGRDNGMVNGSSRGDLEKPTGSPAVDRYDKVAWVKNAIVNIGTEGSGTDFSTPLITGSVYGGGENGHNAEKATVNVFSGTIGIADSSNPWYKFSDPAVEKKALITRGNVFGAGCGTDMYDSDGDGKNDSYNPKSGMVGKTTHVNISGGHVVHNVYGGGSMGSVGTVTDSIKHSVKAASFALSWPYKIGFGSGTGTSYVTITGGRIGMGETGVVGEDNGNVYGGTRGVASSRYYEAHLANVNDTYVTINYTGETPTSDDGSTTHLIMGSVFGGSEDGHVMGDTHVLIKNGLINHSIFGGGRGQGAYSGKLIRLVGSGIDDTYDTDALHSITAGKVYGNTNVTMTGGKVLNNVLGGGYLASVGKGNYSGGTDDYAATGYGENISEPLWDNDGDNSKAFLSSGKTSVNVFGGTVGTLALWDGLPSGSVFGGSRGISAPNISDMDKVSPDYCPEFFFGYVNETEVTIGGYRCKTEYGGYKVGDGITTAQYKLLSSDDADNWEAVAPTIFGSVYGGGQDGHVRRETHVVVDNGEIGIPYTEANRTAVGTSDLDSPHWLLRGNVFGAGSGLSQYAFDLNGDGDTKEDETGYSTSAGSVTHFTQVDINGGTIHRNVYGGGSMASVGPPPVMSTYDIVRKDDTSKGIGHRSLCTVNIAGTVGTPTEYLEHYGGEVYGASRGEPDLDANQFGSVIWTLVNLLHGADIKGNVFGGGDAGMVKKDTDVRVGVAVP